MNYKINLAYSNDFSEKLMSSYIEGTQVKSWVNKLYYYVIDSKYRTRARLDLFLKRQIDSYNPVLVSLAQSLCIYNSKGKLDPDKTIINILCYVIDNFKYTEDIINFGRTEFWAEAWLTLQGKKDDCDGMNGLIYVLGIFAGIPEMLLFCAIGDVWSLTGSGGHFWVNYWSVRYNKFVPIDATYYKTKLSIESRPKLRFSEKRYQDIWYIFNHEFILKPE